MPRLIVAWTRKGGSGKTTLIVNLAGASALQGRPTAILDLDLAQATALEWLRDGPLPAHLVVSDRASALPPEGTWFVDTPPVLEDYVMTVLAQAARLLVPVRPSALDLVSAGQVQHLFWERHWLDKALAILSQVDNRTALAPWARATLHEQGWTVARQMLSFRPRPYALAQARHLPLPQTGDHETTREYLALLKEVMV